MVPSPISHHGDGQTTAAIFATLVSPRPRASEQGTYHQWVIALTLAGRNRFRVGGKRLPVDLNDLLLVRPHTPIEWRLPDDGATWKCVYAVFHPRPHWLDWLNGFEYEAGGLLFSLEDPLLTRLRRGLLAMQRLYSGNGPQRDEYALLELEKVLLALDAHVTDSHSALDPRVHAVIELLQTHYAERWSLRRLADEIYISESHLSHLFRAHLGLTPLQYLERLRLEQAEKMLRFGSASITDVAAAVGYSDPEYFALRFRHYSTLSPHKFRKQARN